MNSATNGLNNQDEVLLAYGLLWCISTTDSRVHSARRELLKCLNRELQAKAISAARTTLALVRDIRQMKDASFAPDFDKSSAEKAGDDEGFGSVRGKLDHLGRRVDSVDMPQALKDSIARCYGLLWMLETEDKRAHRARRGLLSWLTKDEQVWGIENAKAICLMNGLDDGSSQKDCPGTATPTPPSADVALEDIVHDAIHALADEIEKLYHRAQRDIDLPTEPAAWSAKAENGLHWSSPYRPDEVADYVRSKIGEIQTTIQSAAPGGGTKGGEA